MREACLVTGFEPNSGDRHLAADPVSVDHLSLREPCVYPFLWYSSGLDTEKNGLLPAEAARPLVLLPLLTYEFSGADPGDSTLEWNVAMQSDWIGNTWSMSTVSGGRSRSVQSVGLCSSKRTNANLQTSQPILGWWNV